MENKQPRFEYIGLKLEEVQARFINDYGNKIHLWVCNEDEFNREIEAFDTIRILVVDGIVIKTAVN